MSDRVTGYPHWLRDIDASLPVTPLYVLHGNLRDHHLLPGPGTAPGQEPQPRLVDTLGALWSMLEASGYQVLLHHSPIHGFRAWPRQDASAQELGARLAGVPLQQPADESVLREAIQRVTAAGDTRCAIAVDYVSQRQVPGEPPEPGLQEAMLTALAQVHEGRGFRHEGPRASALYNPMFWLVDKPSDLPAWLVSGSDGIRQIPLPVPEIDTRRTAALLLVRSLPEAPVDDEARAAVAGAFAEASEGMTLRGMMEVVKLAIDAGMPATEIDDAIRGYRLGLLDNPWKRPYLRERIVAGQALLEGQVRGQPRAVQHALDILVRSTTGMTAAHQRGAASGPRGVMFFAGPTGVGKTELAKAITRLVFGDERAYVRFDMSEFAAEHAEARLIGAPPGFVGHGSGGELTNALRQRPFCLVLFDEIEKAHPRILDKFLQILSDGRLTDGSGATVHFTEALIVFTSNLGVRGLSPDDERGPAFEQRVRDAVEHEFRHELNRPELLGRIGDNIVVFDFLTVEVATELVDAFLANVRTRVLAEHGSTLVVSDQARDQLVTACTSDVSLGGRGVGLALESRLVNPLARALASTPRGGTLTLVSLVEEGDIVRAVLT